MYGVPVTHSISYVQSKIRLYDVYFECIYGIIETRVYLLDMVKFSSVPSIQNIWNIKKEESFVYLRYLHKKITL